MVKTLFTRSIFGLCSIAVTTVVSLLVQQYLLPWMTTVTEPGSTPDHAATEPHPIEPVDRKRESETASETASSPAAPDLSPSTTPPPSTANSIQEFLEKLNK